MPKVSVPHPEEHPCFLEPKHLSGNNLSKGEGGIAYPCFQKKLGRRRVTFFFATEEGGAHEKNSDDDEDDDSPPGAHGSHLDEYKVSGHENEESGPQLLM